MCGIAGFKTDRPVPDGTLGAMLAALRHRGPDSEGRHVSGDYTGGMRRLAINGLSTGDQPLFNEDKTVALLYNGEIYNSPELRRQLEARGVRFRSGSDGEVICHLYAIHGEALFELLDGMYAAALWIEPERKLILARDIPGEKPLYYAELPGGGLAFASELKSLSRFPGLDLGLSPQALWDFPTFLWVPEPDTVFRSIKAVPRGHLLVADGAGLRLRPIPNRFGSGTAWSSDAGLLEETRRVVEEAVSSRLLSEVPVGAYLSGGLDSSIIVSLAAARLPELSTFTIGFENVTDPYHGLADESAQAESLARALGTRHHTLRVTAADFRRDLRLFAHFGDQPFSVSSALGILAIARLAREQGIKVLLSGDGADECFGGYSWYHHLEQASGPGKGLREGRVSFQDTGLDPAERLRALRAYDGPLRAWAWHYYAAEDEKGLLFHPDVRAASRPSARHFEDYRPGSDWSGEDFIRQDRAFYFPNEMLRKLDRMTMAFSVEGRVPFAAPAVQAHAAKLRLGEMVRPGVLKWALRRAFAPLLPDEVVQRPKHGFNVPIDHWLKGQWSDLVEEAFSPGSALGRSGLIHPGSARAASDLLASATRLNGHTIFSYIMLNLWLEEFFHGDHRGDRTEP